MESIANVPLKFETMKYSGSAPALEEPFLGLWHPSMPSTCGIDAQVASGAE